MRNSWGETVNKLGVRGRRVVNTYPQQWCTTTFMPQPSVYKLRLFPTQHQPFSHRFPQVKHLSTPLLNTSFSALSPPPITTTTK